MGICQWEKNMKNAKASERFVQNLLLVMPDWHSKLVKPFRETLRACGTATMSELAHQMKVPKQQMTKLVDRLSQSRFVERVQGTDDRRVTWIRLTPGAVSYLDEYYLKNTAFIQMLEEKLTQDELERLNDAVEALEEILPKLT